MEDGEIVAGLSRLMMSGDTKKRLLECAWI